MRIAVNTLSVEPDRVGGGETYLSNLVRAMVGEIEARETLLLYCTSANARLFPAEEGDLRIRRVVVPVPHRPRALRLLFEHFALPPLLARRSADVLLSPGNALPPLAGVRHVLALQSMHYRFVAAEMSAWRVAYFRRMVPLAAGRAARVLCMSEDLRRTLLEVAPRARAKSVVVYEGADLSSLSPDGPREAGPYLLFVSSLNPFKRPDRLVEALAALRREGCEPPPARLCGRPDPEDRARVEALAERLGVPDLVRIEGVVAHDRLGPLYRGAAALVYPSTLETFGLPPLEAMACGCPVVASDRTSVPEVVGDAAVVVDPDDVPALAAAIRRVLTDEALRKRLRAAGFANARRFTWEAAARGTLAAIRAAAGRPVSQKLEAPGPAG